MTFLDRLRTARTLAVSSLIALDPFRRRVSLKRLLRLRLSFGQFVSVVMIQIMLAPLVPSRALAQSTSIPPAPASIPGGQSSAGTPESGPAGAAALAAANVDPQTGILHSSIAFELPHARGAVQPSLSLNYSSAGGWGEGGRGWSLQLPSIERHNPSGLPHPENDPAAGSAIDPNTQDGFTWAGAPIVPICMVGGSIACVLPPDEQLPSWATAGWHYYRLETEDGSLARFFWSRDHTQWIAQYASGETAEYGVPSDNPTDVSATDQANGHILRWNLIRRYDAQRTPSGNYTNLVMYQWSHSPTGSDQVRSVLTDIFDTPKPAEPSPTPPLGDFAHHAHLTYQGRQGEQFPIVNPGSISRVSLATPLTWLAQVDVTSMDYGAGGNTTNTTARQQVRRYRLTYNGTNVASVQMEGRCLQGNPTETNLLLPATAPVCRVRPSTTFTYAPVSTSSPQISTGPGPAYAYASSSPPLIFDVNNDGFPDLIEPQPNTSSQIVHINSHPPTGFGTGAITLPSGVLDLTPSTFGAAAAQLSTGKFQMDGLLDAIWSDFNAIPADKNPNLAHIQPPSAISYRYLLSTPTGPSAWSFAPGQPFTANLQVDYTCLQTYVQTGQTFCLNPTTAFTDIGGEQPYTTIDVNGDGIGDLLTTPVYSLVNSGTDTFYRVLSVEFSRRRFATGIYDPFYGSDSPGSSALPARVDVCVGQLGSNVLTKPFVFADMDGDGLPDFVQIQPTGISYWPGHGDGKFGQCPAGQGNLDCDCGGSPMVAPLPDPNLAQAKFADVTGDGLADIIIPDSSGDLNVYPNQYTTQWTTTPWTPFGAPIPVKLGMPGADIQFADMNGSGVNDIVVTKAPTIKIVDMLSGARPGLLTDVVYNPAATALGTRSTHVEYASSADVVPSVSQQVLHVVTSITQSDATDQGDHYKTLYSYTNPVFDSGSDTFLGFKTARITNPGDASSPDMNTETTYAYAVCHPDGRHPCLSSPSYLGGFRGLPVLNEVFNNTESTYGGLLSYVYLSTTHHSYQANILYSGLDGRVVTRIWDAQIDTYLYDPSNFGALVSQQPAIPDVNAPGEFYQAATFVVRDTATHLQTTVALDSAGNVSTVTDHGRTLDNGTANTDDAISYYSPVKVPVGTDPKNNWIFRPSSIETDGVTPSGAKEQSRVVYVGLYDPHGNLLDITGDLSITGSLSRANSGAPLPADASQSGSAHLAHITYDPLGTGNISTVEKYPGATSGDTSSRCTSYSYDQTYAQWRTTDRVYNGACGAPTSLIVQHAYDTVVERETSTLQPDSTLSASQFDEFGRLLKFSPPSETLTYSVGAGHVQYNYVDESYGQYVTAIHTTSDGAQRGTYQYIDGLGRTLATVTTGDAPGQWVLSDLVNRNAKGMVSGAYAPSYISEAPTEGGNRRFPPSGMMPKTVTYDAFARPSQTVDIDGTVTSSTTYHALSVELRGAENLTANASSTHTKAFTTQSRDGHGRVIGVTENGNGSGGAITTQSTYLPTGEITSITRSGHDAGGTVNYARYMGYDSLGRLVLNAEPNTSHNYNPTTPAGGAQYWSYVYNDLGELVGTSDARGCGRNLARDGLGRVVSEDYAPCGAPSQLPYSSINQPGDAPGDGTEVFYTYEIAGSFMEAGRVQKTQDRASAVTNTYDPRGRLQSITKRVAKPGDPDRTLANRYSQTAFSIVIGYNDLNQVVSQTTGARVPELWAPTAAGAQIGPSTVTATYTPRGFLSTVDGSYGALIKNAAYEADGRVDSVTYGDAASTTAAYSYDDPRRRLSEVKVSRSSGAFLPPSASYTPPADPSETLQTVLMDDLIAPSLLGPGYDNNGNALTIIDRRIDGEWRTGAKPRFARQFTYDDSYRLLSVTNLFKAPSDLFTPPLASRMPATSPLPMSSPSDRVQTQTFSYDGLGNTTWTTDDANVFFDRSLGTIANTNNQLRAAVIRGGTFPGTVSATYDLSGNLVQLGVERSGPCTAANTCTQLFQYDWDEVGGLARARRYDFTGPESCTNQCTGTACRRVCINLPSDYPYPGAPSFNPSADVTYAYDARGARVLRTSTKIIDNTLAPEEQSLVTSTRPQCGDACPPPPPTIVQTFTVEIFPSLRLNETTWDGGSYVETSDTETAYLVIGGISLERRSC